MTVQKNKVVSIHYTLTLDDGETVDSSREREPLAFLVGHEQIIPGLENELLDLQVGDAKSVTVAPEQAYGVYEESLVQALQRSNIPGHVDLEEGGVLRAQDENGQILEGTIIELTDERVVLDFNHPLAGETLHFDTEIIAIRDATPEELSHGHVH